MKMYVADCAVHFEQGGIRVEKDGKLLYFNARPVYVSVKPPMALRKENAVQRT